jgi:lactate permease
LSVSASAHSWKALQDLDTVAIASSMPITIGFPPLDAIVFTLMFKSAPVAFAALGTPITVLSAVTHLPPQTLAAAVGRQLPFLAFFLPFYVTAAYGGVRSVRAVWPEASQ